MAQVLNNDIGLTVPGRPSTPCHGRIQHYSRPGDPQKQLTKTYSNGTTMTFGPEDIVSNFRAGDPFFHQVEGIRFATKEIATIRQQYMNGGCPNIPDIVEMSQVVSQYGPGHFAGLSIQNSMAGFSIAAAAPSMAGHFKASKPSNNLLTEGKPRNFSKVSQRGRHHRQHSNRDSRLSNNNNNIHKDSNKLRDSFSNLQVLQYSHEVGERVQQASDMGTQRNNVPQVPAIKSGFHYNSFGAAIPGFVPPNKSNMASQGPAQSGTQIYQLGNHFNNQPAPNMTALGPVHTVTQMHQSGNHFNAQHGSNFAAHSFAQPGAQISQSVIPFNPQAGTWNIATQPTSLLNTWDPALPAAPVFHPGFSFNPQVIAQSFPIAYHPLVAAQYATPGPDLHGYGPLVHMSTSYKDRIMAANGIKLPATYIPDHRCYNGPLHTLATTAADEIIAAVEAAPNPGFPHYRPRGQLAKITMLKPFALPPQHYFPGTSNMEIHWTERTRHTELMQEVFAIPEDPELSEGPMSWYRLLSEPKFRRVPISWHPNVIDLYGRRSQYEQLLIRDLNHRNNNEKGVGRQIAPVNRQAQTGAANKVDTASQNPLHHAANMGTSKGFQNASTMTHARQDSEETSVWFAAHRTPLPSRNNNPYIGYRMRVKRHDEPNPEVSPTPPSCRRKAKAFPSKTPLKFNRSHSATHEQKRAFASTTMPLKSKKHSSSGNKGEGKPLTSKTPLLDFDEHYTAKYGEGDDVDFAVRDMGPPRIGGKTFNEAIGFKPSPEKALESPASLFYPVDAWRKYRD